VNGGLGASIILVRRGTVDHVDGADALDDLPECAEDAVLHDGDFRQGASRAGVAWELASKS
jgi:hypothetical protein